MNLKFFPPVCCFLLLTACGEKSDTSATTDMTGTPTFISAGQIVIEEPIVAFDFSVKNSDPPSTITPNPIEATTAVTADNPATIQDDFTAGIAASQSSKPVGYADISTLNIEATRIVDYPVCSHLLGQPEPYPVIDNNTGKPLDLQPYVAMYPCIPPESMTVCSHQLGEPKPSTQYDFSTGKPLNPQPYLKYYSCFRDDIRKVSQ